MNISVRECQRCLVLALLLVARLLIGPVAALAADGAAAKPGSATLAITGLVTASATLTLQTLSAMPQTEVKVAFMTGHGAHEASYSGVPLWTLLQQAKVVDQGKNSDLRRTVWITGSDGYLVVLSLAELDPDYGARPALIALVRDGKPLVPGEGYRLVIPGDKKGGRAVSGVASIEVK